MGEERIASPGRAADGGGQAVSGIFSARKTLRYAGRYGLPDASARIGRADGRVDHKREREPAPSVVTTPCGTVLRA